MQYDPFSGVKMTEQQITSICVMGLCAAIAIFSYLQGKEHGAEEERHFQDLQPFIGDAVQFAGSWCEVIDMDGVGYKKRLLILDTDRSQRWVNIRDITDSRRVQHLSDYSYRADDMKYLEEIERFRRLLQE